MIITLKGADFSANNIGTLASWAVTRVIGTGATHNIPSFVDKGSAVEWTINLSEGYEFGEYNITMGGAVITPTVDGNTLSISIAEVTGNIKITVATISNSVGDDDQGNEESGVLITTGSLAGAYLHENHKFAISADGKVNYPDVADEIDTNYFIIRDIPVEGGRDYRLAKGRATWFMDADKRPIGDIYINLTSDPSISNFTFTTPAGCAYIRTAFKYSDIKPSAVALEKLVTFVEGTTTLLKDTGATYMDQTACVSGQKQPSDYSDFYTYHLIPVTGGNKYKMVNCRLSYWYDANKNFISEVNFNINSTSATTKDWSHVAPDNAAYLTCCIKSGDVDKDAVAMIEYIKVQ